MPRLLTVVTPAESKGWEQMWESVHPYRSGTFTVLKKHTHPIPRGYSNLLSPYTYLLQGGLLL